MAEQTWTFVGHWEDDRIVVEYVLPGEQDDDRIDMGFWEQGLWAASGSGATMEEAQAAVLAEYEAEYNEPEEPMKQWIVNGTSMVVEAANAEDAVLRAEQMSGWHWEATEVTS
jgi:hypothetical protein